MARCAISRSIRLSLSGKRAINHSHPDSCLRARRHALVESQTSDARQGFDLPAMTFLTSKGLRPHRSETDKDGGTHTGKSETYPPSGGKAAPFDSHSSRPLNLKAATERSAAAFSFPIPDPGFSADCLLQHSRQAQPALRHALFDSAPVPEDSAVLDESRRCARANTR
jgi:hypothetical protein